MKITIEYSWIELPRLLRSQSDSDIRTIIETALHESLAEWRGINLAKPADPDAFVPPEEYAAVRAMLAAKVALRQSDQSAENILQEVREDVRTLSTECTEGLCLSIVPRHRITGHRSEIVGRHACPLHITERSASTLPRRPA